MGAAQLAATLSDSVIVRQRALAAAARQWLQPQPGSPDVTERFLAQQAALGALFNQLSVASLTELGLPGRLPSGSEPVRGLAGRHEFNVAMVMPLQPASAQGPVLAGVLSLNEDNFLSRLPRAALLDDPHLQTVVADQQGYVLAHVDGKRLLQLVDEDPLVRSIAARWRAMGSPLEPVPWTGRFGQQFAAMAAVPGTDWMVFRVVDGDAVFGAASRAVSRTIVLGACVALVGALAIFGLTAWLLKPMGQLRRRALLALDTSQPPHLGWPQASGEVGELAHVLQHVTQQLAASRADIEQALLQMQAVLAHAPVGIAFTGETRLELTSRQLERLLGYGPGELNSPWKSLLAEEAPRDALRDEAEALFLKGQAFESEVPLRRRDGSTLWARVQGAAVRGGQRRMIWIVSDATDARQQREDLTRIATRDPLTELANRRDFEQQLAQLVGDRRRRDADCVLFIDLDHFKQVNDGAGHAAGDQVLLSVARALQTHVRSQDTVGRLGGDEFAVLLRGCPLERAMHIAEQMRVQVELDGTCAIQPVLRVTASIGVVEIGAHHQSLAEVLHAADQACYAAKHAGRNAVRTAAEVRQSSGG
ncbi:MAG: diguanylate cyclase [Acidovorax temperans]|uniref:sensor domain-containing diguanylate cyclase n=1 Tax=Acidovorax temperans TaxID=80878 RepID=UPI0039195DA8